jgi:hypothetical protein
MFEWFFQFFHKSDFSKKAGRETIGQPTLSQRNGAAMDNVEPINDKMINNPEVEKRLRDLLDVLPDGVSIVFAAAMESDTDDVEIINAYKGESCDIAIYSLLVEKELHEKKVIPAAVEISMSSDLFLKAVKMARGEEE